MTHRNLHSCAKKIFKNPMAGAAGTIAIAAVTTTTTAFPAAYTLSKKSHISSSSLPSSFPSRYKRTNHLRKKIIKTLENKPYPDPKFPAKTQNIHTEEAIQELGFEADQFSVSERTSNGGFFDGIVSNFEGKSFAKIGLYLVGAFVFQTVFAVLIFGFNELNDKDDKDRNFIRNGDDGIEKDSVKSDKGGNFVGFSNRGLVEREEGGAVLFNEGEMNDRIVEIREMAREARKQEKIDAKRKGVVDEGDDEANFDLIEKNVKEKEVDGRLMKLRKRFEGDYEKLPNKVSGKGDVGDDRDKGGLDVGEQFGSLMFKKKYKYKSPSVDSGDMPKGFSGMKDNGTVINGVNANDGVMKPDKRDGRGTISDNISSGDAVNALDSNKKLDLLSDKGLEVSVRRDDDKEQEPRATNVDLIAGTSIKPKDDKQASTPLKLGKSSTLETRKPRGFGKTSQDNTAVSNKQEAVNKNGSLKGKKGGYRKSARSIEDKSSTQTDFWWTSLPYVLAVLMQRGSESGESEESSGLFTLRGTSQTKSAVSHTVAFEDRNDATKFCYLLESFFEDLGDFYTNIIPIPTNELEEAVKSQIMNVVVVKKGQLQLYVGQPLTEVESALRILIEQS
uniref:uncharacterized protein LOC122601683 n=1 Tax=Erigeron canadensis TaxID=72917 RepID=UPI001CB9D68C|nr:uncharacterized protein LOC122601683 [Erigeron canadensis]